MTRISRLLPIFSLLLLFSLAPSAGRAGAPAAIAPGVDPADYRGIEWAVALYDTDARGEVADLLERSARAGNPHAHYLLGLEALVKGDCAGAAEQIELAHEGGHSGAADTLVHARCGDGDLKSQRAAGRHALSREALQEKRRALAERDTRYPERFHFEMGRVLSEHYEEVWGTSREAVRWLRMAAERDHARAQTLLGILLATKSRDPSGQQVMRPGEAEHWLRKAAETGDRYSIYVLASMLADERIPVRDPNEALRRLLGIAKEGFAPAATYAGRILLERGNEGEAKRWLRYAFEHDDARAGGVLSDLLLDGSPAERDEGLKLLGQLAARGDPGAQFRLGVMYEFGKHVDVDIERACRLYRDAAESGIPSAINNLANCYEVGKGAPLDYKIAADLYQLAADKGSSFAYYSLGSMHELGHGFPVNVGRAIEYYKRAAEGGVEEAVAKLRELGVAGY